MGLPAKVALSEGMAIYPRRVIEEYGAAMLASLCDCPVDRVVAAEDLRNGDVPHEVEPEVGMRQPHLRDAEHKPEGGPNLKFAEALILLTGAVLRAGGELTFDRGELMRYQAGYMLDIDMGNDTVRIKAVEDLGGK